MSIAADLRRIEKVLDFEDFEMAIALKVDTDLYLSWSAGLSTPTEDELKEIEKLKQGVQELEGIFLEDKIPQVINRPITLLDGKTAYSYIVAGEIATVVEMYKKITHYQG